MAAAAVARDRRLGRSTTNLTSLNRRKALRYRGPGARALFDETVRRMADMRLDRRGGADPVPVPAVRNAAAAATGADASRNSRILRSVAALPGLGEGGKGKGKGKSSLV